MSLVSYDVSPEKIFRTPEESFTNLSGFPYTPRYAHLGNLRYAFIDETSGILHNGKELSSHDVELLKLSDKDIVWETFLCLQYVLAFAFNTVEPYSPMH